MNATATLLRTALLMTLAAPAVAQPGGGGPPPPVPPVPAVPTPPQNQTTEAKRVLGKILFWDEQLSSDNTVACGTCHLTEVGGTDPRFARHPGPDGQPLTADDIIGTRGVRGSDADNEYAAVADFGLNAQVTSRNAPNFFGALWSPRQFWDGRATGQFVDPETGQVAIPVGGSLESQVVGPPVSDVEMAHQSRDWSEITAKLATVDPLRLATNLPADVAAALAAGETYGDLFQDAFGTPAITARRIAFAVAAYERTLVANQTPWDLFNAGQLNALTPQQVQGLQVFGGSVCSQCHTPPLFTDNQFHNIGLRPWQEDDGRRDVTGNFNDRGRFKTPSLRNVGLRDRLMHVGWITDVADAIDFYESNQENNQHQQFADGRDPRVGNINFPGFLEVALADFLNNGLTDPRVAAGTFPFDRPTLLSERLADQPNQFGTDLAGAGGVAPQMIADTQLAVNNPDFRAGIANGLGGSSAWLLLSFGASTPGTLAGSIPIHVDLAGSSFLFAVPTMLSGANPGEGVATFELPLGDETSSLGLELFGQWLVFDPAAPDSLSSTRGARWTLN